MTTPNATPQPPHQGLVLAWATDLNFFELKNTLANLSAPHSVPPNSLYMIPFRAAATQGTAPYFGSGPNFSGLLDRITSVALVLSSAKSRSADVSELAALAVDRHIEIEIFHPVDAHRAAEKFGARMTRGAKGGCLSQEYKMNELPVLLKSWIERQVKQAERSADRIAQSYSGKHWMDAFGGFQ